MSKTHRNISLDFSECRNLNRAISPDRDGDIHVQLLCKRDTDKKHVARRRWGILAKALKSPISSQPSSPTDEISMRRFSSYMLLTPQPINEDSIKHNDQNTMLIDYTSSISSADLDLPLIHKRKPVPYKKRTWYRYSALIDNHCYFIDIGHTSRSFTAADLMGFNNTGNVCVWPSEEALAYYILNNLSSFKDKTILELGAGMSALAGLMVAKYGFAKLVNLTDGNLLAVENVKLSVEKNVFDSPITSNVLQWGKSSSNEEFDVILSADCLFFDEARNDLIETIWRSLKQDGVAYVMAPRRGDTLDIFLQDSEMKGFYCRKRLVYNEDVWNRHLECLGNPDYDEDIHYPILLTLRKLEETII